MYGAIFLLWGKFSINSFIAFAFNHDRSLSINNKQMLSKLDLAADQGYNIISNNGILHVEQVFVGMIDCVEATYLGTRFTTR